MSDARRADLDLSWTFSVSRAPGSDMLAARMSRAALDALGAEDQCGKVVAEAVELACGYLVQYGLARRYRVTLGLDGPRCAVAITDYGYDQPASYWHGGDLPAPATSGEVAALCRELSEQMDGVQVHHALDGAVLVRFRTHLPPAPGTAPGPAARGGPIGPAPARSPAPGAPPVLGTDVGTP
ncbi:hypothetical protein [Wenjunlia tyrosinilytica]|nr:hypothetical protein [Wenjunlia tyrosinilytica]